MATSRASGSVVSRARMTRPYVPLPKMPSCVTGENGVCRAQCNMRAHDQDCSAQTQLLCPLQRCSCSNSARSDAAACLQRLTCTYRPSCFIPGSDCKLRWCTGMQREATTFQQRTHKESAAHSAIAGTWAHP